MLEPSEQLDIVEDSFIRGQADIVKAWEKARPVLEYLMWQAFEEGRRTSNLTQPAAFNIGPFTGVQPLTIFPTTVPAAGTYPVTFPTITPVGTIFNTGVAPATTASAAPAFQNPHRCSSEYLEHENRLATAQEIIEANADRPEPPGNHKPLAKKQPKYPASEVTRL